MKFTEARLEEATIQLLGEEGYPYACLSGRQVFGKMIERLFQEVSL